MTIWPYSPPQIPSPGLTPPLPQVPSIELVHHFGTDRRHPGPKYLQTGPSKKTSKNNTEKSPKKAPTYVILEPPMSILTAQGQWILLLSLLWLFRLFHHFWRHFGSILSPKGSQNPLKIALWTSKKLESRRVLAIFGDFEVSGPILGHLGPKSWHFCIFLLILAPFGTKILWFYREFWGNPVHFSIFYVAFIHFPAQFPISPLFLFRPAGIAKRTQ